MTLYFPNNLCEPSYFIFQFPNMSWVLYCHLLTLTFSILQVLSQLPFLDIFPYSRAYFVMFATKQIPYSRWR